MVNVLIIKNTTIENAAYFEKILTYKNIGCTVINKQKGEETPDINDYSHVMILGGSKSANDDDAQIIQEIDFIKEVIALNKPLFGVCLGMQLLAKAVGGEVARCKSGEIGFGNYNNFITVHDKIFRGLNRNTFRIFQLHNDCVLPSEHYETICRGSECEVQMIRHKDRFYGIQGHIEIEEHKLLEWLYEEPLLAHLNKDEVMSEYRRLRDELHHSAQVIFTNFLELR